MAKNHKIAKCPPLRFPQFKDEWKQTTLGELLNFYSTNSYSWNQLDYKHGSIYNVHYGLIHKGLPTICSLDKVKLPFIKEEIDINKYTRCKAGDLIIADASEDTDDVGKAIEIVECEDKQVVAGLHTIHARSKRCITSLGFKGYLLASKGIKEQIRQVAQGTKVYSISAKLLAPLITSLPSLAEQKKIASFLSLIDERIQSCSETIKERKREKAALLNQLFSQKLRFPQFSDEWQVTIISKLCKVSTGSMNTQDKVEYGQYPFYIRSAAIERANRYTYEGVAILTPGDGVIGKIFHYAEGKIAVHQRVYILSDIKVNAKYLYQYFSARFHERVIRMSAKNTVDSIRMNMITDMSICVPTLAEQKKIADFLSLIDECIEVEEELLEQYERQKRYLLKQMFI